MVTHLARVVISDVNQATKRPKLEGDGGKGPRIKIALVTAEMARNKGRIQMDRVMAFDGEEVSLSLNMVSPLCPPPFLVILLSPDR